jgi:hypothetical protein
MWEGITEIQVLRCLATGTLPSLGDVAPDAPQSVLEIVKRATNVDPANRFVTAQEMQVAIDRALAHEGWLVQPRELVEFMSHNFGESRRERELRITRALRALRGSDAKTGITAGMQFDSKPAERRSLLSSRVRRISDWAVSSTSKRGKRNWMWAVAVTGCLALLGAWATWRQTQTVRNPTAPEAPKTVALEVNVRPRGAEIFLDGKPLGRDHFAGQQPLTDDPVVIEVSAPNHLSQRKELKLRKDMSIQFVLEPDPAIAKPTDSAPSSAASAPAVDARSLRARASSRSVSPAAPRPAARSAGIPSRKCTPPYIFGADGVKTYKPECF